MLLFQKNVTAQFIASVDSYLAGQFKDDQTQRITGGVGGSTNGVIGSASGAFTATGSAVRPNNGSTPYYATGFSFDSGNSPGNRAGITTHGKRFGAYYIMKY